MRIAVAQSAAALLAALLAGPAAAGQEGADMKLEDMGFIMRPATTPAQMERLRLLPARKFVRRTNGARRYYLYADPDYCQCVFVGNELAMKNYQAFASPPSAPPMATGPDGGPVAGSLFQELDPSINTMIGTGDILDYPD
ncbi:MAG TPA: hypothetical protein VGG11_13615 [Xanthobacteraceae bacterium]|jgi:hypothetical protein